VTEPLLPLPGQPTDVPWPSPDPDGWPTGPAPAPIVDLADELFGDPDRFGDTYAVVVVQHGRLLFERYGGELPSFEHPPTPVEPTTKLLSWSMAKSVTHALAGLLVGDGRLDPAAPAPVAEWAGDERAAITVDHLLAMRSGLAWREDYDDAGASDVIEMLFGSGIADTAAFAAALPLAAPPDTVFNYSSGTTNIVSRIIRDLVGGKEGVDDLLARLLGPIGAASAEARFDDAGTFIGSSYVYATARDFARFGLLYLRDGCWEGRRILPEGWVDHARTLRSIDPEDGSGYGAHWWVEQDAFGTFRAQGYEGQSVMACPAKDALLVRLGKTPEAQKPALVDWRRRTIEAIPPV
jgi:CubicO group peptidase (beta-lactamase class C family)